MKSSKQQKGITLVALIITVIVLLILAVVTINSIRNDGIIDYAKNARDDYEDAQAKENDLLKQYTNYLENEFSGGSAGGAPTFSKVEVGEEATENSTINGEDYSATNPVIPAGFKAINTETSSWEAANLAAEVTKGLVISDGISEFVWIPVPEEDINEFARETTGADANGKMNYQGVLYDFSGTTATEKTDYGQSTTSYREPANLTDPTYGDNASGFSTITWTQNLYQESFNKMVESIKEYEGFYVGRYETSLNGTVAQSTSGATPMNNITWWKMYENSLTYSASNTSLGVESEMIWGCQWDAMLRFILTGSEADHVTATTNVAHNLSSPYLTGGTNYTGSVTYNDIASNIYDLEGNVREWTQEANNTVFRIGRGGRHSNGRSPSNRDSDLAPTDAGSNYGSRLALYVKV